MSAAFLLESAARSGGEHHPGRRGPPAGAGGAPKLAPAELDLRLETARVKRFQPPQRAGARGRRKHHVGPYQPTGRGEKHQDSRAGPPRAHHEEPCARAVGLSTPATCPPAVPPPPTWSSSPSTASRARTEPISMTPWAHRSRPCWFRRTSSSASTGTARRRARTFTNSPRASLSSCGAASLTKSY